MHGCDLFKTSTHCGQLSLTWNSESGLKEVLVVQCCFLIRVSQSCLFFHVRRHGNRIIEVCGIPGRRFVVVLIFEK